MNAPGIAFVAVADDIFLAPGDLATVPHFKPGGKARAAASAQAALGHFLDDLRRFISVSTWCSAW